MPVVCLIFMMAACLEFSFHCVWIPSRLNMLTDAASHFQYCQLFKLAPWLPKASSLLKSQLIGMKQTLTSLNVSVSTYGMASHSALGRTICLISAPISNLYKFAPLSLSSLGSSSQLPLKGYLNGLASSVITGSCPKQLNPTSPVFVPCTLMQASHLNCVNPLLSSGSSGVSSVTMGSRNVTQKFPLPLTSSRGLWPSQVTSQHSVMPPSMQW